MAAAMKIITPIVRVTTLGSKCWKVSMPFNWTFYLSVRVLVGR
jgi:hypothetical protein